MDRCNSKGLKEPRFLLLSNYKMLDFERKLCLDGLLAKILLIKGWLSCSGISRTESK